MLVLVTRPHADGEHTCRSLAQLGHEGLLAPLMEIDCLVPLWPQGHFDALVVTSAELFVTHVRAAGLEAQLAHLWHCAISSDAAEPLQSLSRMIKIAERPDGMSLLALLQDSDFNS